MCCLNQVFQERSPRLIRRIDVDLHIQTAGRLINGHNGPRKSLMSVGKPTEFVVPKLRHVTMLQNLANELNG